MFDITEFGLNFLYLVPFISGEVLIFFNTLFKLLIELSDEEF